MMRGRFDFLDEKEKIWYIQEYCELVARRQYRNFSYELFQANNFYIEVQTYQQAGKPKRYFCFEDLSYLEPYLMEIDISQLVPDSI